LAVTHTPLIYPANDIHLDRGRRLIWCWGVTGALNREVNSKVATAPKLKVEDKDRVNNSQRIKTVKLNIVKLKASLNKFSRGKLVLEVECQTLKLKYISDLRL